MKVGTIEVNNFRNLARQKILLADGLNIFTGANAQGKTNLIESVYLCCIGKSPRTDRDKDLIKWGEKCALVKTKYVCRYGEGEIAVTFSDSKKQISINSVPVAKTGELMGYLNCVYFSPDEIKIISRSPNERRRFLDIDLCQTDKNYFYSLSRFNKVLAQRNNLLKSVKSEKELAETIFIWDKQLAEEGARIVYKRRAFCDRLKTYAKESHAKITDGKEVLELGYLTQFKGANVPELTKNYAEALESNLSKDFMLRYTSAGCQRDDIGFSVNGVDIRNFGSQGQLRTAALSLKLAELDIFKDLIGEYPVLLLDDVLSELDIQRQKKLIGFSGDIQIILTSATELPSDLTSGLRFKKFTISGGEASV